MTDSVDTEHTYLQKQTGLGLHCLLFSLHNSEYCIQVARNFLTLFCNHCKIRRFYHGVIPQNDANGIANNGDPDQTAPLGAFRSGSALFTKTCLFVNLGSPLKYFSKLFKFSGKSHNSNSSVEIP